MVGIFLVLAAILTSISSAAAAPSRAAAGHAATAAASSSASCADDTKAVTGAQLTITNGVAKGTFSVVPGCEGVQISLASYTAPSATFDVPQKLFSQSTNTFTTGGPFTLTVDVPSCFYQVDLVVGAVLPEITNSSLYGSRKLAFQNGGTQSCTDTPPPATCPAAEADRVTNPSLVIAGGMATGTFNIAAGCKDVQVSLASYKALTATFSLPQTLFDSSTGTFSAGGPYSLTADVPPCFFQVDLVRGAVIEVLTPDNLYGPRKLAFSNGGSACANTTPPVDTGTPPVNNGPGPTQVTAPQQESAPSVGGVAAQTQTQTSPTADVAVTKTADVASAKVGDVVTYTIKVTNNGAGAAADVTVAEDLPAGLTFVSAVPSVGTCSSAAPVICPLGSLDAGASATIVVKARATTAGTLVNTVKVSTSTPESNAGNNTAQAPVAVAGAAFTPPVVKCLRFTALNTGLLTTKKASFAVRVVDSAGKPVANVAVRAKGSGISKVARTTSAGVAHFSVKPRLAGAIAVNLHQSGSCSSQQLAFQVLAATATSPAFTG